MKKYYYIFVFVIILLFFTTLRVIKVKNYTHVTVEFGELRPSHHILPVYYKGIVIGSAQERHHSNSYEHTYVNLILYPKRLRIPDNAEIILKKEKRKNSEKDYLEIEYPQNPSDTFITNNTLLKGHSRVDIETFMANQKTEDLQIIKENLTQSSENLNLALANLGLVMEALNDILKENQNNLKTTTSNLSKATGNLNNMTKKLGNSVNQKSLDNTILNLENSTKNLQVLSHNLNSSAVDIVPKADSTLSQVQSLACNANAISCGVKQTLSKRFGGLRLLFGKVID